VLFVKERFVDPYIVSLDSMLPKAKGHVGHKSSMNEGIVPPSGIATDARWDSVTPRAGYSVTDYI
jgi:hypothetical protein